MKRIILTIAALAAVTLGWLAAAVPAASAAASPPVAFKLGASCTVKPADYGRGLSLVPGHPRQIALSTKGNIGFTWTYVSDPATTGYGWASFTLKYKGRYLRVDGTHAWLGTAKQVYSAYAGYGDACGGPRAIHVGNGSPTADPSLPYTVWGAHGKVLRAEPVPTDANGAQNPLPRQVWAFSAPS